MTFYELIRACEEARTMKEKLRLLRKHENDYGIKELFRLMLDTSIVYNIKAVPDINYTLTEPPRRDDEWLCSRINWLLKADERGSVLKSSIKEIYIMCSYEHRHVFSWILDRQNPAKIGKSLINKVWRKLIRVQEYMGAVPGTDKALETLPWATGVACQDKEDGMACLVHYAMGEPIELRTRQGQDITKYFPAFFASLTSMPTSFNYTVHHELFVGDLDRKTGNGLINKQVKNGTVGGSVDDSIHSVLLDIYSMKDMIDRYHVMNSLVTTTSRRVKQTTCYTLEDAKSLAKRMIAEGGEGIICKDPSKPFKQGKPSFNVKIKNEFEVELKVLGWKKHTKDSTLLGSLTCESDDGLLTVSVGSGFTDDQRKYPDSYIGCVVSVKAESIIESKGKKKPSLYLPRFISLRDKDKADTYEQIKEQEIASRSLN